jgi:hypothetical protein
MLPLPRSEPSGLTADGDTFLEDPLVLDDLGVSVAVFLGCWLTTGLLTPELVPSASTGIISSVNSDVRKNLRRRYSQLQSQAKRTVYFPKASEGPGFFQELSVYIHPSVSVSLGLITGLHSGSTHFHFATRSARSPVGSV